MSDGEDFSDRPVSITELRAEKERDGSKWTPRDVLVRILREIDNGTLKANVLIVCHANIEGSNCDFGYANCSPNLAAALGTIDFAKDQMLRGPK